AVVGRNRAERQELAAFVVCAGHAVPDLARTLREYLARTLPDWSIPHQIHILSQMPRTTTGKIDLGVLSRLDVEDSRERSVEAFTSRVAEILQAVWRQILGRAVDWQAGFFEQGGDSLTLLEVVAAAQGRGLTLPPALLVEGTPLTQVANWLEQQ